MRPPGVGGVRRSSAKGVLAGVAMAIHVSWSVSIMNVIKVAKAYVMYKKPSSSLCSS
jgi:hypothetical protein